MKVIHVPFCFRPDPVGGTEVYVEGLAREQQRRGVDVLVAAPAHETTRYVDSTISVRRFGVSGSPNLMTLYGAGDATACHEFERIVDQERPQLVHLHAYTSAVSARLARAVRERGIPLVFTYHTPTVSCQRGTLLRWGAEVCDGRLDVRRCASCTLHGLGLDRRAAELIAAVPPVVGRAVGRLGVAGGTWTAVRMSHLVETRHTELRTFLHDMDRVIVLADWARELLLRNGIPEEKLTLSRHGLAPMAAPGRISEASDGKPLRIVFFGRLHPTKGVDIVLRAVAAEPDLSVVFHVFGIGGQAYMASLQAVNANDPRVRFFAPIPSAEVPNRLRGYDILVVPSRWLETGPLVVLEGFEAGTPVIGARLGGIMELVQHGINGLLVEPDSVDAWRCTLRQLTEDPTLVEQLRAGVRPPRRMNIVADEMLTLYAEVLSQRSE